jgi:hypothetical protein
MMRANLVAIVLMCAALPVNAVLSASDDDPRLWFAPLDPIIRPAAHYGGSADYMALFEPNAPWPNAASHIQVFKLYPQFMRRGSDADLRTLFSWLNQHRIALALEVGLLHPLPTCRRTEGFDTDHLEMAQRILRLGGDLRYVVADEPLWFGHGRSGPDACQWPIATVAEGAAASARAIQSVFPRVQFVDGEPISNFTSPDWVSEMGQFLAAFKQAYGQPFVAVHFDIAWWKSGWQQGALAATQYLRRIGEPIGVIYNGNPNDRSDRDWLNNALEHARAYEALVGGPPDDAVFQSWMQKPTRVLPENSPDAFTSVIVAYARSHAVAGPPIR